MSDEQAVTAAHRERVLLITLDRRIVDESALWDPDEAWLRQSEIADPVFASEDSREGATAFAERRPPVWKGR